MTDYLQKVKRYFKQCPVTADLILVDFVFFIVTLATGGFTTINLVRLGALVPTLVLSEGEILRILVSMFLHGSVLHFAMNMLALYFLGTAMERSMGSTRYLLLYLISGIGAGIAITLLGDPYVPTIGASGALYGIMAGMLFITFRHPNWFTPASVKSIRQTTVLNFILTFLFPNISILGHVAGFVFGFLASALLVPKIPYFLKFRPVSRPVEEPDDDAENGPVA